MQIHALSAKQVNQYTGLVSLHTLFVPYTTPPRPPSYTTTTTYNMRSALVHATLAQPAVGADALKDLRARRSEFF
eukprot:COSAG05_NODE_349_length_10936_cov_9.714404_11_plen_75_part_00